MARLTRHRHGAKRYTTKDIADGELTSGASAAAHATEWEHMTIRLREAEEGVDSYSLQMNREECERLVRTLREFLTRGPGAPIMVNGSKGHA